MVIEYELIQILLYRNYFNDKSGYECILSDCGQFSSLKDFLRFLSKNQVTIILGIHLFHSGEIITGFYIINT